MLDKHTMKIKLGLVYDNHSTWTIYTRKNPSTYINLKQRIQNEVDIWVQIQKIDSKMIWEILKFPNGELGVAFESGKAGCQWLSIWKFQNFPNHFRIHLNQFQHSRQSHFKLVLLSLKENLSEVQLQDVVASFFWWKRQYLSWACHDFKSDFCFESWALPSSNLAKKLRQNSSWTMAKTPWNIAVHMYSLQCKGLLKGFPICYKHTLY